MRAKRNNVHPVLRGGSYYDLAWGLRVIFRYGYKPEGRDRVSGFRLVIRRQT